MTELQCADAPHSRWHIGPYTWERYSRAQTGPGSRGRWGCQAHGRGVGNHRTPVGAWFALRRWLRKPSGPPCG